VPTDLYVGGKNEYHPAYLPRWFATIE